MTTLTPQHLPLGPLMIDIAGLDLSPMDQRRLGHSLVGGVILFARNYQNQSQLSKLCAEIHALRVPALPIAIDHEGGRVQRCRDGFTSIPCMRALGQLWDRDAAEAQQAARAIGYLLADELRECGVDISFTPVLDLDWGPSSVIGDRSFHREPAAVIELAGALIEGLHSAGLGCCGKHFPGHGWAAADSHVAMPVDERNLQQLAPDIEPYRHLPLDGVMPAHVMYPSIDARPAGFSPVWIGMLREELGFSGVIFSDDLSMEGASVAGGIIGRADAAWNAGCDLLLVCNAPESLDVLLAEWKPSLYPQRGARLERLVNKLPWQRDLARYAAGQKAVKSLLECN